MDGTELRRLREGMGLRQTELAAEIGVPQQSVSRWEASGSKWTARKVYADAVWRLAGDAVRVQEIIRGRRRRVTEEGAARRREGLAKVRMVTEVGGEAALQERRAALKVIRARVMVAPESAKRQLAEATGIEVGRIGEIVEVGAATEGEWGRILEVLKSGEAGKAGE